MKVHPEHTTVKSVITVNGRWVITLSCGHKVRVKQDSITVKEGQAFACPERPIGVVYPEPAA